MLSGRDSGTRWSANGRGNYWSRYRGFDFDGDGIGDAPHPLVGAFERLEGANPAARIFLQSPAATGLELAARLVGLAATDAIDDRPLAQQSRSAPTASAEPQRRNSRCRGAGHPRVHRAPSETSEERPMLTLTALTKTFGGRRVLDGVDLEIGAGESVAMLGANGSGKTTTLRCIVGLARPDAGRIVVGGIDLARDSSRARARLSYLPQKPVFPPTLTVRETLAVVARLRGIPAGAVDRELELVRPCCAGGP